MRIAYTLSYLLSFAHGTAEPPVHHVKRQDFLQSGSEHTKTEEFTATIFTPPPTYPGSRVRYARMLTPDENSITIATFESQDPNDSRYFPIYRSKDAGHTWKRIAKVHDTHNGWGMRFQPHLLQFTYDVGNFLYGDVLLVGNSVPEDLSATYLDVYFGRASEDEKQWTYMSTIAKGGRAIAEIGETPVWEPFLYLHGDTIICYYSDQRDPLHGQKIVYQTSTDAITWTDAVDVVASSEHADRPGKPTMAQSGDYGSYMLAYESCCSATPLHRVRYKLSDDPLNFLDKEEHEIVAAESAAFTSAGSIPVGSPYVGSLIVGGQGVLLVSCGTDSGVWFNLFNGDPALWWYYPTLAPVGYSRAVVGSFPDTMAFYIVSGGPDNGTANKVTVTLTLLE